MSLLQVLSRTATYQTIELNAYNKDNEYTYYLDTCYNYLIDKEDIYIGLCEYSVNLIQIENNILKLTIRE